MATAEIGTGVAAQEGLSEGADAEDAIDSLLRQANGCWATGDPTRFLALHSDEVIAQIALVGPIEEFARQLRLFMATPLSFERIGPVNLIDRSMPGPTWRSRWEVTPSRSGSTSSSRTAPGCSIRSSCSGRLLLAVLLAVLRAFNRDGGAS